MRKLSGLAALAGWRRIDVPGATGYLDTDYAAKGRYAIEAIGRDDTAGIVIEDDQVSRRHALVTVFDDGARVNDLGSTNGTWVNGARIAMPHPLLEGDELRVGGTRLRLLL